MKTCQLFLVSSLVLLTQVACGPATDGEKSEPALLQMPLVHAPSELDAAPVSAMAPAPALSYLQVYAVISSNYPWYEYVSKDQFSTVQDHGGAELYVVTVEYGYGQSRIAKINGAFLTELTDSTHPQPIVDSSNTIIGWYRWWIANGHQGGGFSYQSTSINSPWNTMYDSITVR